MRIVAGSRKGATIYAPKGRDTRPTSDRVREAAFAILGSVEGANVLDLFAGSGALGLEALSRGAASATFVESDPAAVKVIERNLEKLGLEGRIVRSDVRRHLARTDERYDVVFVDPPYEMVESLRMPLAEHLPRVLSEGRQRRLRDGSRRRTGAAAPRAVDATPRLDAVDGVRRIVSASAPVVAICPGSYDPVTYGHVDVIRRAAEIFDHVVVGVVRDPAHKGTMFSVEERVAFLEEALGAKKVTNVEVDVFAELVVEFARKHGAKTMVKGLRVISDFEWEFQMNHLNRTLAPDIETLYVMASPQYSFVSSSGVKEIASFGGAVDELVPPAVAQRFRDLFPEGRPGAPVSPSE